jgi:hypothetical protein
MLGSVKDIQGGAISGAAVKITETQTNVSRSTMTNASGNYTFASLQDGLYKVDVEMAGFKKVTRDGVVVKVNTTVRVDLVLPVGTMGETVHVVQEMPALQTDRADTGRLIESKQLMELPLGFGRNFQNLLVTVPGATRPFKPHSEFMNSQDSLATQVNGQSRLANNVMLDGVDNNHRSGLLTVLIPSADAIDTVTVSTSNYDAEFGRAGGAVSNVTLKSGTNQLKGSLFFFGNDDATQAKEYFTGSKAKTSYKQFGATLGGPIAKDKLFFFADYQGTRDRLGRVLQHNIPPIAFRSGDFSSAATKIYDPATGNADGTGRQQFSGNVIPPNRINPIAMRLLALLPEPNQSAALGQNNYVFNGTREKDTDHADIKLTYQATVRDSISYRLSYERPKLFDPGTYGIYGGPSNGGFAGTGTNKTYSTALNWTHMFENAVLDTRLGMSYYRNVAVSQADGLRTAEELGITGINLDDFTSGITTIQINQGYSNPAIGFSQSLPWERGETTYNLASTLTKLAGNHTIKVGFDVRHNWDLLLQVQDQGGVRGRYTFSASQTGSPTDSASTNGYANSLASFLLGTPSQISRDLKIIDEPGLQHWSLFTFVHDKWQIAPKVTLDLGLRHEFYTPMVGLTDKGGLSNYDPVTNTLRVAGYDEVPANLGVKKTWDNFAPRLGISYRMNEKTVLRGGYGLSIVAFPDNQYAYNYPVKQNNLYNPANSFASAGAIGSFPAPVVATIPDSGIIPADTTSLKSQGYNVVPLDLKEGKVHSWNVALQRQLPARFSIELAYVGNRGRGILMRLDRNAGMVPGQDNAGRPQFASFGRTATAWGFVGTDTRYDGLQVKLDHRYSNGLLWTNSYTFGRSKDYGSDGEGGGPSSFGAIATPADWERSYGFANTDRTHVFVSSLVYELPIFREAKGLTGAILGGWQVSGILVAQSGLPIDITTSNATLRAPGNTQRPDLVGTQKVLDNRIGPGNKYFDTTVYAAPPANTFGNMTRLTGPRGPGFFNIDATLIKRVRFSDRIRLELRADAFNVLNHPNFGNPNGTFGGATFGEISSYQGSTRLVRFGARVSF